MREQIKVSIVLAFYNDIQLLHLTLDALSAQDNGELEVLIADDGSCADAVDEVRALSQGYKFPIKHLWQPDDGFGKTIILNKAVVEAKGEVLIFMDADCVPQAHFIADHLSRSVPGVCLVGRRINVFRDAINILDCGRPSEIVSVNFFRLLWWSLTKKVNHFERGIRLPVIARLLSKKRWGIVGCNFSVHKTDLLAVNGFDERHRVQWGAEDSDLQRRLEMSGVKLKSLVQLACQVHFDASFFRRKTRVTAHDDHRPDYLAIAAQESDSFTPYGIVKKASLR